MKYFNHLGAVVSMSILAAGLFMLWKHGLSAQGTSAFFVAAVSGFCISLTLQVFTLRRRIGAIEKTARRQAQAEA
jgi:hypothetical protein